jgi:hypothetical protein
MELGSLILIAIVFLVVGLFSVGCSLYRESSPNSKLNLSERIQAKEDSKDYRKP